MSAIDPVGIVTSVGFPIGAFLLVYYDLRQKLEHLSEEIQSLCLAIAKSNLSTP